MIKTRCITLGKFEKNSINEDAVCARKNLIAVSDGAGGGGLFADIWSKYLVSHLPHKPITTAEQLDEWIGLIWESYYNMAEKSAKKLGGMALDKFYDEGSFATLAAVWSQNDNICHWMTYGDSVVFHYDYATKKLTHSFTSLADFNNAPYLINCKDELNLEGFWSGRFPLNKNSIVFVTSDALSHYILMMYELSRKEEYASEIERASSSNSKNINLIAKAQSLPNIRFEKEVIDKLRKAVYDKTIFQKWTESLYRKGLLVLDDYSLAVIYET
ncbi:MAG: hypothetical protein K2N35_04990 [Muribaculaceae bacterium]|nr:hypothetical protein [Muribaculaceae bacterium]